MEAIAWGRASTGVEGAPARAMAAWLLVGSGQRDEARSLVAQKFTGGFLERLVAAELATTPGRRRALHEEAGSWARTDSQLEALQEQRVRLFPKRELP